MSQASQVVIIGGGIMGGDIATVFAAKNWKVHVMSPSQKTREALAARLSAGLKKVNADTALVTGAAGGVGSVAIALLAYRGYRVLASTGRPEEADYLRQLGAAEVIERTELSEPSKRPMGPERWAHAVDAVGSHTLVNVLGGTRYGGVVAACGLAQGGDLAATVYPFILRGVSLVGVDSVMAPLARRREAWARLAVELDLAKLAAMTTTIGLAEVPGVCAAILDGRVRGRVVVDVSA